MALHHAKTAASSTGNTGEALAPWEEEHSHLVECDVAPTCSFGFLQNGCCYGRTKRRRLEHIKGDPTSFSTTRWHTAPHLCADAAGQIVKGHLCDSLTWPYHVPN